MELVQHSALVGNWILIADAPRNEYKKYFHQNFA